jgi:hypothetical protein
LFPGESPFTTPGVLPTNPQDLALARLLAQSGPQWPPYFAGQLSQLAGRPLALQSWQIDLTQAFPRSGLVVVLNEPGLPKTTPLSSAWFPATGRPFAPGRQAPLVALDQEGVTALRPSTCSQLYGQVDRLYWRRPFAMTAASDDVIAQMGQEMNHMLKP